MLFKLIVASILLLGSTSDTANKLSPRFELSVNIIAMDRKPEKIDVDVSRDIEKIIPIFNSRYMCSVSQIDVIHFNGLINYGRHIECKFYGNKSHVGLPLTSVELTSVCGERVPEQGAALTVTDDDKTYHFIFTCKFSQKKKPLNSDIPISL